MPSLKQFYISTALLVILMGCTNHSSPLVGKWKTQKPQDPNLIFSAYGQFKIQNHLNSKVDVWGVYTVADKQITFQYTGGNYPESCRPNGVYTYQVNGNQLMFRLIQDSCESRQNVLKQIWTKEIFEKIVQTRMPQIRKG